jgi:hypothetical protein
MDGWTQGGCRVDGCACKVFERDRDHIPPSKALTPREKRERLTREGAAWLKRVGHSELSESFDCSDSMATRFWRAISFAGPFQEGDTLERLKGGDLGPKGWRTLIQFLREKQYVFGDDKPCPTCGRKGAP